MTSFRQDLRNIAIIAHVDHGKTTLVDNMLKQAGVFRDNEVVAERLMDRNDLERERGITILAKNASVTYRGVKINIIDTPGHADFGGEVERTLLMADGALLLVDAAEGPLPQTRFVLRKALDLKLKMMVAINKIDRKDARIDEVLEEVYALFFDLGADDSQIDFPVLYTNGRAGVAHRKLGDGSTTLEPLFETILTTVTPPVDRREEPLQLQVNNLDYDAFLGRIAVGRVRAGNIAVGRQVAVIGEDDKSKNWRVAKLFTFRGVERVESEGAGAGDVVAIAGIEEVHIGDTIAAVDNPVALPRIRVDEPTLAMFFSANNSPFAGREGKWVTSRNLRERLFKEAMINVAIRVEETDQADTFRVIGRGELQLAILVETMRREGYELMLSRPEVVTREVDGRRQEPVETLLVDVPDEYVGAVTELTAPRKAQMTDMSTAHGRTRMTFRIPTRGLIGFNSTFRNLTRGMGIYNTLFEGWTDWQGDIPARHSGALVSDRPGVATPYALDNLQPRGVLFIPPGTDVYEGMIVGEHNRENNLGVNVCREKKLTNMRAAGKDDNVMLSPHKQLSLEEAIEFINPDELAEITPKSLRLRKRSLRVSY